MACSFCMNAYTNPALNTDNDLSYRGVGRCDEGYRIFFRSGDGRPTAITFEDTNSSNYDPKVGEYVPRFCPECGRELIENYERQHKECIEIEPNVKALSELINSWFGCDAMYFDVDSLALAKYLTENGVKVSKI